MPTMWEYTAHAGDSIRRDVLEAESAKDVRAWLREQGFYPLSIRVAPKKRSNIVEALKKALKPVDDGRKKRSDDAVIRQKKTFTYVALPFSGGDEQRGEITAFDERTARGILRERNLLPTKLKAKAFYHDLLPTTAQLAQEAEGQKKAKVQQQASSGLDLFIERFAPRVVTMQKVPIKEMVFYCQQMATMLDAGLPVSQTLDILSGNIRNRRLLRINNDVLAKIYEGISLADAFAEHKNFLPDVFCELVAIGEQSGNMEETTNRLSDYLERTYETQRKVKSAMSYPIVLVGLILLIVLGLMIFVVPTFIKLFDEFKLDLPPTTKFLLASSSYLLKFWWTVPIYFFGVFFGVTWFMGTAVGKNLWDQVEFKLPLLGKLNHNVTISRMLYNLALFLKCGVPITSTLEHMREATRNYIVSAKIEDIRLGIVQGARLAMLFEATALFPSFVNHLLVAGEESGAMDELILKGAKYVDQEIDGGIKALTSAIEPIMTVVIAGVVLFILGSLYLPLISLMSNTGKVSG